MAENTAIEWTDHTFNPWEGCQKVGPGCDHCYAEQRNERYHGGVNWGPGAPRRRTSASNWAKPLRWAKQANEFGAKHGRRQRVFCASLADVFDNAVDPAWRLDLFKLIDATPELDWLLLTKRIGNVPGMLADMGIPDRPWPDWIWLGATVVNQEEADRDIPKLLAVPATVRFLSMEPLLGPVDLASVYDAPLYRRMCAERHVRHEASLNASTGMWEDDGHEPLPGLDWVIVGGESGPGARPMHPDWARSLRDQCAAAGVPFFFKQWGEWLLATERDSTSDAMTSVLALGEQVVAFDGAIGAKLGKKRAGRLLDGRLHDAMPEVAHGR